MMRSHLFVMLLMIQQVLLSVLAFRNILAPSVSTTAGRKFSVLYQSTISDRVDTREDIQNNDTKRQELKRMIVQLGASYDRGFGASPRVRNKMEEILGQLEMLNSETNASRGIDDGSKGTTLSPPSSTFTSSRIDSIGINGDSFSSGEKESSISTQSPLCGNWRMIWTTAQDVLILGANPLVTVGAIYQFINPPLLPM